MRKDNPSPSAHSESRDTKMSYDYLVSCVILGTGYSLKKARRLVDEAIKLQVATQVNEALLAEVRAIYKELSSDDPEFNRAYFKVRIHELQSLQDKEVK